MKALALADDATGALETGARLRDSGLDARVRFTREFRPSDRALVLDTETRHLPGAEAYRLIREICKQAKASGIARIFKKTDSTLRGPIAPEFRALLDVWPERSLVYAPAYPAMGRTIRGGELYVNGVPLSRTAFAADLLNPSTEGSIAALLAGSGADVVLVPRCAELFANLGPGRILVCDGETDADLEDVAAAVRGTQCMVAGTAAMASAWATASGGDRQAEQRAYAARTCLVVNGSLHPASQEQLAAGGMPILTHQPADDAYVLGMRLADLLERNRWAAMCTGPPGTADPRTVAAHIARTAGQAIRKSTPDCLMVFGGDTVFAILGELGIQEAEPHTELLPGVPASSILVEGRPMTLVTKAGGFGGPGYLASIREILEKA